MSETARDLIADPDNGIVVSAASAWEIATKHRLGRLSAADTLVRDIPGWIRKARFGELPITVTHAQRAGSWPQPHRDPFDRMLAAQAAVEDLALLSGHEAMGSFGVRIVW